METNGQNGFRRYRLHPFVGFLLAMSDVFVLQWLKRSKMQFYEQGLPLWLEKVVVVILLIASVSVSIIMVKDYIDNMDNNHILTKYVMIYLVFCCIILTAELFM